jgi:hypothetical protein
MHNYSSPSKSFLFGVRNLLYVAQLLIFCDSVIIPPFRTSVLALYVTMVLAQIKHHAGDKGIVNLYDGNSIYHF